MHMFLVFYIAGEISRAVQMPNDDPAFCQQQAQHFIAQCKANPSDAIPCTDVQLRCELHDNNPAPQ